MIKNYEFELILVYWYLMHSDKKGIQFYLGFIFLSSYSWVTYNVMAKKRFKSLI